MAIAFGWAAVLPHDGIGNGLTVILASAYPAAQLISPFRGTSNSAIATSASRSKCPTPYFTSPASTR